MKRALIGLAVAILMLTTATGLGLGLIHITDFPYTADIEYLDIPERSGLSRGEITANYGAVMEFLSPFSNVEFDLPTLAYSETGAGHFDDCKVIFNGVYLAALISLSACALLFAFKRIDRRTLKYSGIFTAAIPVLFGLAVAINFDRVFVMFHSVFFEGDTWIFDQNTDEIIKILPEEFFMHCAIVIASFWIIAAAAQLIIATGRNKTGKAAGPESGGSDL